MGVPVRPDRKAIDAKREGGERDRANDHVSLLFLHLPSSFCYLNGIPVGLGATRQDRWAPGCAESRPNPV